MVSQKMNTSSEEQDSSFSQSLEVSDLDAGDLWDSTHLGDRIPSTIKGKQNASMESTYTWTPVKMSVR